MSPKKQFRPAEQYIGAIQRSDYFQEERTKNEFSAPRAFGDAALKFVVERQSHSEHLDLDTHGVRLIGLSDAFIEGSRELDTIRAEEKGLGYKLPREDKLPHLKAVIPFNHALRDLIDAHQEVTGPDILTLMQETQIRLNGPANANYIASRTREVLVGMKHELAVEAALHQLSGVVSVESATEKDELKGIDLIVTFDDGRIVSIDVKAREKSELESSNSGNKLTLWSGLDTDKDFHNGLHPTQDMIRKVAKHISWIGEPKSVEQESA